MYVDKLTIKYITATQVMDWYRPNDKALHEPVLIKIQILFRLHLD